MASELSDHELNRLAQLGAQVRIGQLDEERRSLLSAFPGLAATIARQRPATAGKGGLMRGQPRLPSRDSSKPVSSPQMYAPAPRWRWQWWTMLVPGCLVPKMPAA